MTFEGLEESFGESSRPVEKQAVSVSPCEDFKDDGGARTARDGVEKNNPRKAVQEFNLQLV